ncbi:DUF885 domain-containing protein [Kaistella flava (ex Peng et al. 2021)]|uniref:DUF885 domain-containing protein n=1 Tax=Kaistella flava (ex Peng et al. 2021) TaxID=2038776 RepID=A0A7M2YCZ5_9FLAO|nr:DUF885 domain-containing protein [Kaistella flava (ex Peng et al. 2021)]QOW11669.1 DUF885 domain-containing protein [Kaistella flava (ex Peng et al. 2021)]
MNYSITLKKIYSCIALVGIIASVNLQAQTIKPNEKLNQLFDNYYTEGLKVDPISATFNGENQYNDLLPATDAKYLSEVHQYNAKYLDLLKKFDINSLNEQDKISYQILKNRLESTISSERFHWEYMPVDQFNGYHLAFAILGSGSSAQPFKTTKDYDNWLKRCEALPNYINVSIENMRKGVKTGTVIPRSTALKVIPQLEQLSIKDSTSVFYGPIRNFPPSFSQKEKAKYTVAYKKVIGEEVLPAYQKLLTYFETEYLPKTRTTSGINALPNGTEMYLEQIYENTSSRKSAEAIHQIGLSEVARITGEMTKIKDSIGFKGSLPELFTYMKTNKRFMPFKTKAEVLAYYQNVYNTIKPKLPQYFGVAPKTPFEIRETESFRAAAAAPQYYPGDLATNRPGVFYVPILDPTKVNETGWEMQSLFLHEAIPGHHFQMSLQDENETLPKFRQKGGENAFVEGWALYCESLGKKLGVLKDPYHQIGALGSEMHRAIRLVVDTGIHTGEMTREQAIKYMMDHEAISEAMATQEIERYMVFPGQALGYKMGELKIIELRDKYQKQLGDKFSLRDFHDAILNGGSMPLDVFEMYMDDWAKTVK